MTQSYYFNDIKKIEDFDFDNTLINARTYKNILVYDISYKTLVGAKPLEIIFDKVDGFIGCIYIAYGLPLRL